MSDYSRDLVDRFRTTYPGMIEFWIAHGLRESIISFSSIEEAFSLMRKDMSKRAFRRMRGRLTGKRRR
jgi:hypothetical protein